MPYESITAVGEYVFALWDKDQDAHPVNFSQAIGTPASVVRKNGQSERLICYPTKRGDRNWLSDNHIWFSPCLFQAENAYNVDSPVKLGGTIVPTSGLVGVEGKIIIDVYVSFRDKPLQPSPGKVTVCT